MDPGTRLGPHELLAPLGARGMGEVYLAEDTRLRRKVALKLLPVEYASEDGNLWRVAYSEDAGFAARPSAFSNRLCRSVAAAVPLTWGRTAACCCPTFGSRPAARAG